MSHFLTTITAKYHGKKTFNYMNDVQHIDDSQLTGVRGKAFCMRWEDSQLRIVFN